MLATSLAAGLSLSGCSSFAPVYSSATLAQAEIDLAYAEPTSRTEQIIYQDLRARLGESTAPSVPLAKLAVASSGGQLTMTEAKGPNEASRLALTATLTISSRDGAGTPPIIISRTATAEYTTNDQVLANQASRIDAEERAARSVAESLRLAILATLSR